jgi:hypothetical protein
MPTIEKNSFPSALTTLPHWVCWRLEQDKNGRDTKVPYNPALGRRAATNNPKSWAEYDLAARALKEHMYNGLGFVFTADAGIVGVDLDHCLVDGKPNDTAKAILAKVPPTYIEVSPSGNGLHFFLRGTMPGKDCKNSDAGVEMYGDKRFFTMTGKRFGDCPLEVADDDGVLAWIHSTYLAAPKKQKSSKKRRSREPLTDEEILDKAQSSGNGEAFAKLWRGEWQGDFGSQSEADFALCSKLAFWSGKNREQMDRMFRASGLYRPKWDERHHSSGATYGEETLDRAIDATEESYGAHGDDPVFSYEGRYFRRKGDNIYPLTNFVVQPIEMIISDDETQMTADLVTVKGEIFRQTFMTTDFSNLQKFKNILNKRTISLSYTGSEGDLELLKNFVAELNWVRKTGVKALGLYVHEGRWVYVSPEGAHEKGGKAVSNIVQLEKYQAIKSGLAGQKCITAEQLKTLGALLLGYNEPAKSVSVLAWCAGCFIKPHLRRCNIKFPHLFLIGEAGSGKSNTLERVILPIFSRTKVTAATQVTPFTLMRDSASSNMIPQPLDEFKPSKMDKLRLNALYNHFRDAYDGHEGQRGRADQTVVSYDLLAPMVVAGEESADEAAVRERGIELLFSRKDLKNETCRAAFAALCAKPELLSAFGRGLLEAALRLDFSEAKGWFEEACGHFDKALPSRIVNNLACCAAGLRLVERLCAMLGFEFQAIFDFSLNSCLDYLGFAAQEYLLDGGSTNRGIIEQSLEIMARMGLDSGTDFKVSEDEKQIAIRFPRIYDRFTKYRRDYAIVGECLDYRQFLKQIRNSDLFLEYKQTRFDDANTKAYVLDYQAILVRCDINSFTHEVIPSLS